MKITRTILAIVAVITTFYLLLLGYYNNLVADDFSFVCSVEKLGIWGFISDAYLRWQGRFTYYFVIGVFYEIFGRSSNLIGYTIILLILGYLTYYRLVKDCIPKKGTSEAILIAVVLCNLSIMSFFDFSTFYWVCTPDYYLLMYATILLFDMVFLYKGSNLIKWLLVGICAFYICGNLELYLAILIFFLGIGLLLWFINRPRIELIKNPQFQMLLFTMSVFVIGFLIQWFAPGTKIRMAAWQSDTDAVDFMNHFSLVPFMAASLKALSLMSLRLIFQTHYYLIVFAMALALGYTSKEKFYCDKNSLRKMIKYVIIGFVVFLFVSVEISVFSLGCLAPMRSYTFIHFTLIMCICYCGLLLGANSIQSHTAKTLYMIGALSVFSLTVIFTVVEYPIVIQYKSDLVRVYSYIKESNNDPSLSDINVKPLDIKYTPNAYCYFRNLAKRKLSPNGIIDDELPGFFPYLPFELSTNPEDFKNKGLREYLGVDKKIVGWLEPNSNK